MTLETIDAYIEADLVHSIHVSERRSFRGCRRRWSYIYQGGYYPLTTAKPLEFGIAYHKALEHWYHPDTWGIDDESRSLETLRVFMLECERQKNEYYTKKWATEEPGSATPYADDPEVEEDYAERVALGQAMLQQMFMISWELDAQYRPVGVETSFEVAIPHPYKPVGAAPGADKWIWCKCNRCWKKWQASEQGVKHHDAWQVANQDEIPRDMLADRNFYRKTAWKGLPVTLGGRLDALLEDTDLMYWVADWKTAAKLSTGEPGAPDDFLWLDDQITSYCLAMWLLGLPVRGFIYHEQKKAVYSDPEPLRRPWKGAMYSQNRQNDVHYTTYLNTVRENDSAAYAAGVYDDYLEYLRDNAQPLYKRHVIHRNPTELTEALRNLGLEALEMVNPDLAIYPSPGRFSCNGCAFREPCLAQNKGEDVSYTLETLFEKREKHYYEQNTDKSQRG